MSSLMRLFYGSFAAIVAGACAIVLIPGAPLGVITVSVQALPGVLLPSASVFLLLLCNDKQVLGPWVNKSWLNALAALILGVLVMLSAILVVTTVFPHANMTLLLVALSRVLALGLVGFAVGTLRTRSRSAPSELDEAKTAAEEGYAAATAAARAAHEEALAAADGRLQAARHTGQDAAVEASLAEYDRAKAAADHAYGQAIAAAEAQRDEANRGRESRVAHLDDAATRPARQAGMVTRTHPPMYTLRGYLLVAVVLLIVKRRYPPASLPAFERDESAWRTRRQRHGKPTRRRTPYGQAFRVEAGPAVRVSGGSACLTGWSSGACSLM